MMLIKYKEKFYLQQMRILYTGLGEQILKMKIILTIQLKIYTCTIKYTQSNITLFRVRKFKKSYFTILLKIMHTIYLLYKYYTNSFVHKSLYLS